MAELKDFGVPGTGIGILHPTMANKFRFRIGDGDRFNLLTAQTTRLDINMVKREIKVWVEQPMVVCQDLLDLVEDLGRWDYVAYIELLDGGEGVTGQIKCFSKLIDHSLKLDYAVSGIATHELTFQYSRAQ